MIDRQNELKNCNSIKAILMLLVVLYHSMAIYAGGTWGPYQPAEESRILGYIAKWLNSFHIYGFTLISGYLFYYIKYEKKGYQKYLPFLVNKAKRLLIPYVFISVVWVIPVNIYFYGTDEIVNNFVLGKAPNQLWFLLMLFWAFAMFWPVSDFFNKKPMLGGIIVCVLYAVGLVAPGVWRINQGLQYLLFFYLGFLISKLNLGEQLLYKIPSLVYLLIDVLLFAGVEILYVQNGLIMKVMWLGLSVALHMLGAISAFVLLQRLTERSLGKNKAIAFFAKHSMVIYLVHQQLVYFSIGWVNGIVPPVGVMLINMVFSVSVSTVFSILMNKTKVTRLLIGEK